MSASVFSITRKSPSCSVDHPDLQRFVTDYYTTYVAFSALTPLVGWQEGHPARKKYGGWWRVSPDGVAPSRMFSVSASVNLPLHHKVQKFSSGTGSPGWSRKKGCKMVVAWCGTIRHILTECTVCGNSQRKYYIPH